MTKQLITLIGALVSIAVVAIAVVFGVLPQVGQAVAAIGSTTQVSGTNAAYQSQISNLQKQKQRKAEIDASVRALRGQIPADPDLDKAFDAISGSAQAAGVALTSVSRGDLAAFVERVAPIPAGPAAVPEKKAEPVPQPTAASGPATDTKNPASASTGAASQTPQATGVSPAGPSAQSAIGSGRQQIPITLDAMGSDSRAVAAFLDGLRASERLLAVDKVSVVPQTAGLQVTVSLFVFVSPAVTK